MYLIFVAESLVFWLVVLGCAYKVEKACEGNSALGTPVGKRSPTLTWERGSDFWRVLLHGVDAQSVKIPQISMFMMGDLLYSVVFVTSGFLLSHVSDIFAANIDGQHEMRLIAACVFIPYHGAVIITSIWRFGFLDTFRFTEGNYRIALYAVSASLTFCSLVGLLGYVTHLGLEHLTLLNPSDPLAKHSPVWYTFIDVLSFLTASMLNPIWMILYELMGSLPFITYTAYLGLSYLYVGPNLILELMEKATQASAMHLGGIEGGNDGGMEVMASTGDTLFPKLVLYVTHTLPWLNLFMGALFILQRVGIAWTHAHKLISSVPVSKKKKNA